MKILGINKLYEEGFKQNIISLANINNSCEIYFNSKLFQDSINNKIMSTKCNYDEDKDEMEVEVNTYTNIPILDRINEKVLCNYYRKIKYVATYEKARLIAETVEILD
ncbi:MAG: hypothetical protein E6356_13890 [Terrisporobacter othiniensis]|nr:hypothetical protein [Terrisporobacter othiniensis]